MSTLTKPAKAARKPTPPASAKVRKAVPAWIGRAVGKAFVRLDVDLTKPTIAPGRYL